MEALVKSTVLPELELLARPFDRRFGGAVEPRYHDPAVYEAHRLAGHLFEALRGAYHNYLYTGNPKSRLACIDMVWEMANTADPTRVTALLLFAAINVPSHYQVPAEKLLLPSDDEVLRHLASHDGWRYFRSHRDRCKRYLKKHAGCPDILWMRSHSSPTSPFVEWLLTTAADEEANTDADAGLATTPPRPAKHSGKAAGAGASAAFTTLMRELDEIFATRRHYDPEAIELFQRLGLHYAEAPGSEACAMRYLRQAVWGAYCKYLVEPSSPDVLVGAVGALMHGYVLRLHRQGDEASDERTRIASTVMAGSRRLYRLCESPHFLLFQAFGESVCKPDDALGTYLQYFQARPLDGTWQWLEKVVWARIQSRDIFFL